jgi:hypothetical protein
MPLGPANEPHCNLWKKTALFRTSEFHRVHTDISSLLNGAPMPLLIAFVHAACAAKEINEVDL